MISRTLTPILSFVIALILFVFFVRPQYAEVKTIQADIDAHQKAIAQYTEFSNKLEAKIATKENRSALQNEQLDQLVPDDIDNAQILVDLEALAQRHNLLFGNTEVSSGDTELKRKSDPSAVEEDGDTLLTSDISFGLIGTYDQFKLFLADLERSLTLFEVIAVTFDSSETVFQQFEVTVRVYALPKK
jgi:hypothetical protein